MTEYTVDSRKDCITRVKKMPLSSLISMFLEIDSAFSRNEKISNSN